MKFNVPFSCLLGFFSLLSSCNRVPGEEPILPIPGLSLYRDAIPVSELQEPGCEPQMPIDSMWHRTGSVDSNYIRDLVVNPNNSKQWVYVQHVVKPGETWNILWYVDLEKWERKQLDSFYRFGYGNLTWGGRTVAFTITGDVGIINVDDGKSSVISNASYPSLSPKGDWLIYTSQKEHIVAEVNQLELSNEKRDEKSIGILDWTGDYSFYATRSNRELNELELHKVYLDKDSSKMCFSVPKHENGLIAETTSLDRADILFFRHISLSISDQTFREFYPYCDRQRLEKIVPLHDTREYLTIKTYRETVDSYTTHIFHHFHVFDENWENERRVTLNFDF